MNNDEDDWWPYQILLCKSNPCRQEGMLRFRLKRDRDAAIDAMTALGFKCVLCGKHALEKVVQ